MKSTVYFGYTTYGNYLENYYTDNYNILIQDLIEQFSRDNPEMIQEVNLGITDGVAIKNNFKGDFTKFNTAIVVRTINGVQESDLYFIISKTFVRRNIWSITLMKDVISKYYQEIINSDISVNRIGLTNRNTYNELLLLNEGIDVSNVKRKQILLEHPNNKPCYAIFYTNKSTDEEIGIELNELPNFYGELTDSLKNQFDESYCGKVIRLYLPFHIVKNNKITNTIYYYIIYTRITDTQYTITYEVKYHTHNPSLEVGTFPGEIELPWNSNIDSINWSTELQNFTTTMSTALAKLPTYQMIVPVLETVIEFDNDYYEYHNKYMERTIDGVKKSFYVEKKVASEPTDILNEKEYNFETVYTMAIEIEDLEKIILNGQLHNIYPTLYQQATSFKFKAIYTKETTIYYERAYDDSYDDKVVLPKIKSCEDQPYSIIMIPQEFIYENNIVTKEEIEKILYALSAQYSGNNGRVIDIQLVPYGMIKFRKDGQYYEPWEDYTGTITIPRKGNYYKIPYKQVNNTNYSINIEFNLNNILREFSYYNDKKLLDYYKIVFKSPSGATSWEINALKNGGNIQTLEIQYNLRPYTSYYRLVPQFNGIYGQNYNDIRGLIWKENRSITLVNDAFSTYQRQNLNYIQQFSANIEYQRNELELLHEANHTNFKFDSGKRKLEGYIGAISAPFEGAAAGSVMGPYGALAGAGAGTLQGIGEAIGTAVSEGIEKRQMLANEKHDIRLLNNRLETERRQFNYNLSNIRALPRNVEKITGIYFTDNNVPYVEIYSPTNTELEHLKQYFDLYGVNVGKIIDLSQYDFNYLQASIIRLKTKITIEEYDEINHKLNVGVRKGGLNGWKLQE